MRDWKKVLKDFFDNRQEELLLKKGLDEICIDYSGFGKIIDRTDLGVYKNNERELVLTNFDENMNYTNKFNRKEDFDLNKEHPVLYGVIENIRLKASLENTLEKKEEKSRKLKI
jgi:hypothetical protein